MKKEKQDKSAVDFIKSMRQPVQEIDHKEDKSNGNGHKDAEDNLKCPNCGEDLVSTDTKCPKCLVELKMVNACPICQAEIADDVISCPSCGIKLKQESNNTANEQPVASAENKVPKEVQNDADDREEKIREEQRESKIEGDGFLFNRKKKHLPESSIVNEQFAVASAIARVKALIINPDWDGLVSETFIDNYLQITPSIGGIGRKQYVAMKQFKAVEKEADAASGAFFGKPAA